MHLVVAGTREHGSASTACARRSGPSRRNCAHCKASDKARPERRQLRRLQEMIDLHSGNPWESVVLTSLFSNQRLFTKLLNEARELAQQQVRRLGSA